MTQLQLLDLAEKKNYEIIRFHIERILNSSTKQKLISAFIDNKLYFFFKIKNRTFCVSERSVAVLAAGLGLTLVVTIKKIFYRYKIGKNLKTQLKRDIAKTRGGQNSFESLQKEIIDLEDVGLSQEEALVKSIIQKCLKPGKIYRIVNLEIVKKVHDLIKFRSMETTRIITYDVFVHVLIICTKRWLKLGFFTTVGDLRQSSIAAYALVYSPIASSTIMAMLVGLIISPHISILPFLAVLSGTSGFTFLLGYPFMSYLRQLLFIDCGDFVKELFYHQSSDKSKQEPVPFTQSQCDKSSDFFYTPDIPIKEDIYLETSPNLPFCAKVDPSTFKLDTLDGSVQNYKQVDGSTRFGWLRDLKERFKRPESNNSKPYIPLDRRTVTLSDCTASDTTDNLRSAKRVIEAIETKAEAKAAIPNAIRKDVLFDAGLEL